MDIDTKSATPKEMNFNWNTRAKGMRLPSSAWRHTDGCSLPSCGCPCVQITPVCLKCWFCSRWMKATCTNSTFDSQRLIKNKNKIHHYTPFINVSFIFSIETKTHGPAQAEDCYPEWERSAHTAVGQVIITTCTVSTLSHSGLLRNKDAESNSSQTFWQLYTSVGTTVNGGSKLFGWHKIRAGFMSLRSLVTERASSHQGCRQAEDGQEGPGRSEGCVLTDSGLFSHLHISCSDVIGQWFWYHRLLLSAQSNVAPAREPRLCLFDNHPDRS